MTTGDDNDALNKTMHTCTLAVNPMYPPPPYPTCQEAFEKEGKTRSMVSEASDAIQILTQDRDEWKKRALAYQESKRVVEERCANAEQQLNALLNVSGALMKRIEDASAHAGVGADVVLMSNEYAKLEVLLKELT